MKKGIRRDHKSDTKQSARSAWVTLSDVYFIFDRYLVESICIIGDSVMFLVEL